MRLRDCKRRKGSHVRQRVYRLGAEARVNWSATLKAILPAAEGADRPSKGLGSRLKMEFLRIVMEVNAGHVCSLPLVSPADVARAEGREDGEALAILNDACQGSQRFFEVAVPDARRRKQIRTASLQRMSTWAYPAMVQEYTR